MSSGYSINGYLNAVLRRSAQTLLVEGVSDQGAIARFLAESPPEPEKSPSVDTAELISDQSLGGLGAKQKILVIREHAANLAVNHPGLATRLATLIDREWDGVSMDPDDLANKWTPPRQDENNFITVGHSIENYHVNLDYVISYLRFAHAPHYTIALETGIAECFAGAVALGGSVSFAARECGCITRMCDLIHVDHIQRSGANFSLGGNFVEAARARNIADPEALLHRINDSTAVLWSELVKLPHAHWLLHGHVGVEVMWACIARVAKAVGVPQAECEQIAGGKQQERRRHWYTWLAAQPDGYAMPITIATRWLLAGSP